MINEKGYSLNWVIVLRRFASYQRAAGLSEKTIRAREETLLALSKHSERTPQQIELQDLIRFLNRPHHHTGESLSVGTKQTERSYLVLWGKWMMVEGITAFNPSERLPKVRVPRRAARPIHLSDVRALYESGAYEQTLDKITIGANSGLRVGEIVKIHEDHYDYRTDQIYTLRKGGVEMWMPVPATVRDLALRKRGEGWWFPSPYPNREFPYGGGHILMKSASNRICNAMRRIGIDDPRITAHSLRHFYCCMLLANGTPVQVVQKLMGHASLATTQLYAEIGDEEIINAVQNIPYIGPFESHEFRSNTKSLYLP